MKHKHQNDLLQDMVAALEKGGHVFAERGAGKTRAVVELMKEDNSVVTVVHNMSAYRNVERMMLLAGFSPEQIDAKLFIASSLNSPNPKRKDIPKNRKIIVDEWSINEYRGGYWAAISSLPNDSVVFGF